jgi:hypothetical protein
MGKLFVPVVRDRKCLNFNRLGISVSVGIFFWLTVLYMIGSLGALSLWLGMTCWLLDILSTVLDFSLRNLTVCIRN